MRPRPVHRLRRRLVVAFTVFALLIASVFGVYSLVFMYAVEDSIFNAQLDREAQAQRAYHARTGHWGLPADAAVQLHDSPATFPADLRTVFAEEPWRSEFGGEQGRHYHVKRLQASPSMPPAWLVYEVSEQLVVRPVRDRVVLLLGGTALGMILVAILLGLWLARRATRPLYALVHEVEALQPPSGQRTHLADRFGDDEIGVLARALDGLSERVAAFIEREHAFTRDASHELRTPLSVISSAAGQLLGEAGLSARGQQHLQHIRLSALQLQQAMTALLALAREEPADACCGPVRLVPLLERVIVEQSPLLASRPVDVQLSVPHGAALRAPEAALQVVLANLIGNAFAHTPQGTVSITFETGVLQVYNTASSTPSLGSWPTPRPFQKRADSSGSGLGLEIMRRLCDHHGLHLDIQANDGGVHAQLRGQQCGP
ncbi:HAMP domain-containing histidine kinase [Stenotrophomonas maltophilia]|uniref:sensor histidine kinase n=1 Tax=Stenotrophomonas maltophilia TaxID=40324 RepID=UPI000C26B8AA|nr:HAMP domain-containing sensor histidine kinase [Stenotrophomonas maltophilia]MBH1494530.1 HAMP domain-containing histidine kinase [Stenotrophomonas maltophilia]MBN4964162.1 HAMP domain-containing histidine kinase [Stenotrophomonas maltophilia]MBN5143818.1 HAMP domain-containing histidine kinase [Stenotrophomonas maltophilia]PJL43584.1 hypothetical protein B9Y56_02375 [Stenotrophomonas maltophilia]